MYDGGKVQRVSVKNEGSFVNSMSNTIIGLLSNISILQQFDNLFLFSVNVVGKQHHNSPNYTML